MDNSGQAETSSHFFELFENAGLLRGTDVNEAAIARLAPSEIVEIAEQSCAITAMSGLSRSYGMYTSSATSEMGGGARPCSGISCRLENALRLAQFAGLYADRVYVPNLLMDAAHHPDRLLRVPDRARERLQDDLVVLSFLRPFIEAGLITPVTPDGNVCPSCLAQRGQGPVNGRSPAKALRVLEREYLNALKITAALDEESGRYRIRYTGPEEIFAHGYSRVAPQVVQDLIEGMPRLRSRVRNGEEVPLGADTRRKIELHCFLARETLWDINFEMATSRQLGSSFLTQHPLHVTALNALLSSQSAKERNDLVYKHLSAMMPFVGDLDPADLLLLRQREAEAFILFRNALTKAVESVQGEGENFSDVHARQLFSDVLEPGLATLDARINAAKRGFRGILRGAVAKIATLSFGLLPGADPTSFSVASLAGLLKDAGGQLINSKGASDEATRAEHLYFLWRVRKHTS